MNLSNLLSIHEAAKILGVSPKTLRRWEKQKLITPERTLGNQRRYRQGQLDIILRQRTISKWLIPVGIRKLFKLSSAQKFTLAAIVTLTIISASLLVLNQLGVQYSFSLKLPQIPRISFNPFRSEFREPVVSNIPFPSGTVLAAQTTSGNLILKVNVPTLIDSTATVSGNLTAPNIVYNLLEGTGIDITGDPQIPTISTTDQTTDLKIFNTFKVGSSQITAGSKTDTLTFAAGSNISLSTNTTDKKLTISAALSDTSGWTDDGSIVRLSSASDSVSIGIATAEAKLNVFGQTTGKALALFNESGDQSPLTASVSGTTVFDISNSGVVTLKSTGFLDLSNISQGSSSLQGLRLPQSTSLTSPSSGEGFLAYDTDDDQILVYNGSSWSNISGASTTLQQAYDNDTNGSDTIIAFTTNDDSIILRNPASSGTDSGYILSLDQLATGNVDALRITNVGNGTGLTLSADAAGQAAAIINKTGAVGDIFTASASSTPRFTIGNSGNFTIPAQTALSSITSTQTTTNVFQIDASALTQGYAQVLNVNGSTTLTTGGAINIDGPTGAATLDATTGLLNISSTGAITNSTTGAGSGSLFQVTGNGAITPTLASISDTSIMTTTGKLLDLTANAATTTTGLLTLNATGLNSGFAQNINVNGTTTLTSGGALNIVGPTGAAAISGGLVQISSTGAFTTSTANVGGLLNLSASGTATGTVASIAGNALTTGLGLNLYSTSTVLTTGKLGYFNWEPSAVATASGDLVGINIGNAGDITGNLFNITTSGSSLFSVSETSITSALPHSFTAAGDVSLAYDLLFTNQTASYLKSNAPLYIQAGETFESNNLTLKTYNSGNILLDTDTAGEVLVGTGSASLKFTVSDSFAATAAAMIENQYNGTDADGLAIKLGYTGNGATTNRFISFLNGSGVTVGRVEATTGLGVAYQTTGIDFAEYFVKDSTQFEEGDIVTLKSNGATKSNTFSDPNMIGIVSSSPGFKSGEEGPNKVLVGLVGQVPVKISPTSDSIQIGDLLSSSSDPGRAVKATRPGFTIAKALEPWSPNSDQDKILAFVNPAWADPGNLLQANVLPTPTPTPTQSDQTILTQLKVDQSAEIGIDLRVLGQLQVEGALTVTGVTNFIGTVFFNKDTAGFAAIPTGTRFVTVNYEKEYLQPPVVTANPVWDTDSGVLGAAIDQPVSLLPKQDFIIAASGATGFTILLEQPAVIDLKFSWTALSVKDPRTISAPAPTP